MPARWKSAVEWEVIAGDNKLRIHTKNFLTVEPKWALILTNIEEYLLLSLNNYRLYFEYFTG